MTPLYTAVATATGDGRNGRTRSDDGLVDHALATPPELGGAGGATNPEQLFAAGYAACFHSALKTVARAQKTTITDSAVTAEVGIGHVADAGMAAVAAKGRALTGLGLRLCDQLGLDSPTPRDEHARGAHVAVRVPDADASHAALTGRGVITDVRRPDVIRLGCAPLTTRFVDVWDGLHAVADVAAGR